ncbi:STAS/SEC14 domain-containing protein [Ruegeria sediminis]|uniref:STAS/SEC14 domain-containing protein n=1 Tax=Ruegeria sediminis TaxID=2583820 RepID=A0ABY2WUQ8_9RHOB|nr:STAS/SEC14 domain-containing protein [Ruegeria sediminis]TMV06340.1 STAS/SEC14 domain-containing protein [Ruegeria sediminis]
MISITTHMDGALIEAELSGEVTSSDYADMLVPAVEAALTEHDRIRLLVIMGQEFSGYDLGAAWADTKLGLGHWSGFDRVAVVSDQRWVQTGVRLAAPIMPCPVQVFDLADLETARRWIRESLGSIHVIGLEGPCIQVKLQGELNPEAYERAEGDLDARIRERNGFRLLLDLSDFEGWQGISALTAHFHLVRNHAPLLERAAIVGDKAWQRIAQRVGRHLVKAETQFFPSDEMEHAKAWLAAG